MLPVASGSHSGWTCSQSGGVERSDWSRRDGIGVIWEVENGRGNNRQPEIFLIDGDKSVITTIKDAITVVSPAYSTGMIMTRPQNFHVSFNITINEQKYTSEEPNLEPRTA